MFLMVLPGISVFGLFVVGDLAMRDLLDETTAGTLRRQLAVRAMGYRGRIPRLALGERL